MVPVIRAACVWHGVISLVVRSRCWLLRSELQFAAAQRREIGRDVVPADLRQGGRAASAGCGPCPPPGRGCLRGSRAGEEAQADPVLLLQGLVQAQAADPAQRFQRHLHRRRRLGLDGVRGAASASLPGEAAQPAQDFLGVVAGVAGVDPVPLRGQDDAGAGPGEAADGGFRRPRFPSAAASSGSAPDGHEVVGEAQEHRVRAAQVARRSAPRGCRSPPASAESRQGAADVGDEPDVGFRHADPGPFGDDPDASRGRRSPRRRPGPGRP